jgi:penicillin amidase
MTAWTALRRIGLALVVSLIVVLVCAGWLYYRAARGSLPTTSGRLVAPGLDHEVTVIRDRWGTPHITAASERDLYFTQGYVTAQDRLWQMDMARRDGFGEFAEVVGESALEHDINRRTLGFRQVCEAALPTLAPEMRAALEDYARGVNACIEANRDSLPFEFQVLRYEPRPWQPVDTLVIGKSMALTLGNSWPRDLMRQRFADLDPQLYADLFIERSKYDTPFVGMDDTTPQAAIVEETLAFGPPPGHDSDSAPGSNNWVVGGSRTASGKPLLANDPHLRLAAPPVWYAVHLRLLDGSLDVAGVTFAGTPGVVIGHNDRIAWGVTNFNPDVQDLYDETFDSTGKRYLVGAEWRDASIRSERILVRGGSLTTEQRQHVVEVVTTRHGPIIVRAGPKAYALRWTALEPRSEMAAFYLLNRARDWSDFTTALATYPGPMQNFIYADRDGNIGYYAAALVPVRRRGFGDRPYVGAGDDGDWIGWLPFEKLPHVYNPPSGFIATANNRVVGTSVGYFYTKEWMAPFRARRITELLASGHGLTAADMSKFQGDTYSLTDHQFARLASRLASDQAGGRDAAEWQGIVSITGDWDGTLSRDSAAAALVTTARRSFIERVLTSRLGERRPEYEWFNREALAAWIVDELPDRWRPAGASDWAEVVLDSYRDARSQLEQKLGEDPATWRYGALNTISFEHPLNRVPGLGAVLDVGSFELDGGPHCVKAIGVARGWGPSMRLVVDLADLDRTTLNLTTGQSGQHSSPHYADQVQDWVNVTPHAFPFSENAVAADAADVLVMVGS